jgi:2-dehydro-3-deoxyphosphogluconate aldolase/(4S)-4-hydroxy-2-oxoglutarate aldolase
MPIGGVDSTNMKDHLSFKSFKPVHAGGGTWIAREAVIGAETMARLFSFIVKDGTSSTFAGAHGHIAIATLSVPRALAWLLRKGIKSRPETTKEKDGRVVAVYLDLEVTGFAVHLLQR